MRIGFEAKRVFYNSTGLGNYSRTLLSGLKKFAPEHEYSLFTPGIKGSYSKFGQENNFTTILPEGLWKIAPSLWRRFGQKKGIQQAELDIYHGLSHELPDIPGKSSCKYVVTIHDLIYLRFPHLFSSIDRKIYDYKFRQACERADKVIALSQQTSDDLQEFFQTPPEKIEVLYQSFDPQFYDLKNPEDKAFQSYHLEKPFILYVGSLIERKQGLAILKAYKKSGLNKKMDLVFIGKGRSYQNKMEEFIYQNKLMENVKIFSNVPFRDLPFFYQAAEFFVWPSLFEGFGIPLVESLSQKTPVITSQGSCFSEAAGPGGIYVRPGDISSLADQMIELSENQKLRTELGGKGFEYIQKFKLKHTTEKLLSFYQSLI